MTDADLETLRTTSQRAIGAECSAMMIVPDFNLASIFFANGVIAYIRVDDNGDLCVEVDTPILQ